MERNSETIRLSNTFNVEEKRRRNYKPKKSLFIHMAGPDTALLRSSGNSKMKIIIGGRLFAMPVFQRVDKLSLRLHTINVRTNQCPTFDGIRVNVNGCVQFKIQGWETNSDDSTDETQGVEKSSFIIDNTSIRLAAQHFAGKRDGEIEDTVRRTLAGYQRAIIGSVTFDELHEHRSRFVDQIANVSYRDMRNMGLSIVSYTFSDLSDDFGYMNELSVCQNEKIRREAMEGKVTHRNAAISYTAKETADSYVVSAEQTQRKIEFSKQTELTMIAKQRIVTKERAIQQKAHSISSAEQDSILLKKRQEAKANKVEAEVEVMKQKVKREQLRKKQEIHVDADARLYQQKAEAQRIKAMSLAEAEKIRLFGKAQGESIAAQGLAKTSVLREQIEIWKQSGTREAILDKIIAVQPKYAAAVMEPFNEIDDIKYVSVGGEECSELNGKITQILAEIPEVVEALTGHDLNEMFQIDDIRRYDGEKVRNVMNMFQIESDYFV